MSTTRLETKQVVRAVAAVRSSFGRLFGQMHGVLISEDAPLRRILVGLPSIGHMLIEGVPGSAKRVAVRCLARAVIMKFRRLQFLPDRLSGNPIGMSSFRLTDGIPVVEKRPVLAHVLLAGESNRTPAKVQPALLALRLDGRIGTGRTTSRLDEPFLGLRLNTLSNKSEAIASS